MKPPGSLWIEARPGLVVAGQDVSELLRERQPRDSTSFILFVAELAPSRSFYEQLLGLPPRVDEAELSEFSLPGGTLLGLVPLSRLQRLFGTVQPGAVIDTVPRAELYLQVESPEVWYARALSAGARPLATAPGEAAVYALDPDGHVLAFAGRADVSRV